MKNLITGGAGFIGTQLINYLLKDGQYVFCIDNFQSSNIENIKKFDNNPNFCFINHDICESIYLKVDQIWHLACPASPYNYQKDPIKTSKTIFMGTYNMLNLAKNLNAKLLFASSSEIYGQPKVNPQNETDLGLIDTNSLRSCYQLGKKYGESLCFDFHRKHNLDIKIVRIFNTYGPNLLFNDGRVISNFIFQSLKNESHIIYGTGNQTRSFCYIDDLIKGLLKIMDSNYIGTINIGSEEEISILDLSNLISSKLNANNLKIIKPENDGDPKFRRPDISLAKKLLNWEPKVSLKEGLDKTILQFKRNLK